MFTSSNAIIVTFQHSRIMPTHPRHLCFFTRSSPQLYTYVSPAMSTVIFLCCCFHRRLSSKTKCEISAEEQEFFDSMEQNIRRKQVRSSRQAGCNCMHGLCLGPRSFISPVTLSFWSVVFMRERVFFKCGCDDSCAALPSVEGVRRTCVLSCMTMDFDTVTPEVARVCSVRSFFVQVLPIRGVRTMYASADESIRHPRAIVHSHMLIIIL